MHVTLHHIVKKKNYSSNASDTKSAKDNVYTLKIKKKLHQYFNAKLYTHQETITSNLWSLQLQEVKMLQLVAIGFQIFVCICMTNYCLGKSADATLIMAIPRVGKTSHNCTQCYYKSFDRASREVYIFMEVVIQINNLCIFFFD